MLTKEEAEELCQGIAQKAEKLEVPFTEEQLARLTHACQHRTNWDHQIMGAAQRAKKRRAICVSCHLPKELDEEGLCRGCQI